MNHPYHTDSEFSKLLARHSDVDLTIVALELARDVYPQIDFQQTLTWIDNRANELSNSISLIPTMKDALTEMSSYLSQEFGVGGSATSFKEPESSYLNRVVETGQGIPISLSLLYMAIGSRIGLELQGVAAPMRFLCRCETPEETLFLDPFDNGKLFDEASCMRWLMDLTGRDEEDIENTLAPAHPRVIVMRMLNNLKALYTQREEWRKAWQVQQRLSLLQPGVYAERRDLALISLNAGQEAMAIRLLDSCLKTCPSNDKELLEHHLQMAHTQHARWN